MKYVKIVIRITIIAIIISCFSIISQAENLYDFSSFNEDDSMDFIEDQEINIPEEFLNTPELAGFTNELIITSYYSQSMPFHFNYHKTQKYAEDIYYAVKSYVNIAPIVTLENNGYQLQYNTVKNKDGVWATSGGEYDAKWYYYNCYAYAINRAERPPYYCDDSAFQYQPGDMSNQIYDVTEISVYDLAEIVKDDLLVMGYTNISLSSTIPEIDENQTLIAIRKNKFDYHFMRYDLNTDKWYHKPGDTCVLRYNYIPQNELLWHYEYSFGYEYSSPGYYDSDIIFISYFKNVIDVNSLAREYIQPEKDVFCEINIETFDEYDLLISSNYPVEYELYNGVFDRMASGNGDLIIEQIELNPGQYYLRINMETPLLETVEYVDIQITDIHTHYYTYGYESRSASSHKAYCICGEYIAEAHNIQNTNCVNCGYHKHSYDSSYESANETLHYMYCICGTYALDEHNMQNGTCTVCGYHVHSYDDHYVAMNDFQHYCYCICGERTTAMHVISQVGAGAPGSSRVCLICGRVMGSGGTLNGVYTDLPHTENGSYILPNGIIVLVPEDEEAFFNGTLEFRTGEVM